MGPGTKNRKQKKRKSGYEPKQQRLSVRQGSGRRRRSNTSWERSANWYDGWVGKGGSAYHRRIAVPTVMKMLELQPGHGLLDVGCGQGVLAPHVARAGASYTGLDASPRMIELARRRHAGKGRFLVGNAELLPERLHAGFHAAVFMLSLQDMEPLDTIIEQAAKALLPRGRLVIFMVHPCFRVPRQSGWSFDKQRKLPVRRIDSYLTPLAVPMGKTTSFHRPLEAYIGAFARSGLVVDRLLEIPDDAAWVTERGRTNNAEIPLFMALRAVKVAGL